MAFIRFIDEDYHILGERYIKEIPSEGFTENVRKHIKELNNPKCIVAYYWTDDDIKRGYDHPYQIPTKEYQDYLIKIGRY